MPQPTGPRQSATPKSSASVCGAPGRSARPQTTASSRSGAMPQSGSAFPDSVLLDKEVYMGRCPDNVTTARAETSDGDPIEVSFLVADPPALTRCFVYCPALTADDFFKAAPKIMAADGAFLLIRAFFARREIHGRFDLADFFVYRSGPGTPSLELLPVSPFLYPRPNLSRNVGILSCGEHCLVVDLRLNANLHVFSSKTKSWSTKLARLGCGMDRYRYCDFVPYKVFRVEGGSIAWVDFREGILLCNSVNTQDPEMQLIQLPPLTPVNSIVFGETPIGTMPSLEGIRDVSCKNGLFRFIEIERRMGFSSQLRNRWEVTMFKRRIHSDKWTPCGTFDSTSLSPANSCSPCLCADGEKIWGDYKKKKKLAMNSVISSFPMNSVISSFPTLDMCRNDVVYMLAKVEHTDPNGWVLSINTKTKKLQKMTTFSAESPLFRCIFLQCGFSKHLSGAPGARTGNGRKDDIKEDLTPLVPYVTSSLLVQEKLRQLEKYFTQERPPCDEVATLFHTGVVTTTNVHTYLVTQYATNNGLGKAALDAVNTFERALKDMENMIAQYRRNGTSTSAKVVGEKVYAAIKALDELLNMLPLSLLDTGRSMVSVGCMDSESVVEGSTPNICIPALITY